MSFKAAQREPGRPEFPPKGHGSGRVIGVAGQRLSSRKAGQRLSRCADGSPHVP
jgi:hypothetical protein